MLTLGIDLAAQNKRTAACQVEWRPGRAVARAPVLGDAGDDVGWLVELARKATWVGIDAPFGWPEAIVSALPAWADGGRWPAASKDDLRYRLTDQIVRARAGRPPLSVSSDLIAVTAWRCARLLDALRPADGRSIERTGADGVFEVYPGAALGCWGFNRRGYKTSGNAESKRGQREARSTLVAEIRRRAPWLDLSAAERACEDSDDALDALLASLVARAAGLGLTEGPEPKDENERRRIGREGWIHLPADEGTLSRLV